MIVVSCIFLCGYISIILALSIGFKNVPTFSTDKNSPIKHQFSIVIPFRNEADNIPILLDSISNIDYPSNMYEIIFIDDFSEDNSSSLLRGLTNNYSNIRILSNDIPGKKQAIEKAISESSYDWIVTTDADCIVPKNWLNNFSSFLLKNNAKFIAGPVAYTVENNLLEQFQNFDFVSLIGATIGSFGLQQPFLCNGANLCYNKTAFLEVNGFNGNSTIASGDDVFLLEKIAKTFPNSTHYLKATDSLVYTTPQKSFKALSAQRIRWAAKTTTYQSVFGKMVAIGVFTSNLWFLILLTTFFYSPLLTTAFFIGKMGIDSLLFKQSFFFLKQKFRFNYFVVSGFLYPFFSCYIAIRSLNKGYVWKGRYSKK